MLTDKNGKKYILNKNGEKCNVIVNELGQSYILDAKGNKEFINQAKFEVFTPKIQADAYGNSYIVNEKGKI